MLFTSCNCSSKSERTHSISEMTLYSFLMILCVGVCVSALLHIQRCIDHVYSREVTNVSRICSRQWMSPKLQEFL